jgi:hypothetical protein
MPKLTLYHPKGAGVGNDHLSLIKVSLQRLAAEAATTEESPLTFEDVDFVPIAYDDASTQFSQPVAIEIETFGYPARKAKMTKEAMTAMKVPVRDILAPVGLRVELDKPLIWLKFQDPDGQHV